MNWKNWNVITKNGRQYWENKENCNPNAKNSYHFDKKTNSNSADQIFRDIILHKNKFTTNNEKDPLRKGWNFFSNLQLEDGNWGGDYGGPHFLLPGLIITSYVTNTPFSSEEKEMMSYYMLNQQNEDGGWGLHIEDKSTMFGTVLQYVALRLLGEDKNKEKLLLAKRWILENGGATGIPSWGKFYLAVLGIYDWKGCQSLLPEMWILPRWIPFHPTRYWCHARMVYLPMSYCYGNRITHPEDEITKDLKTEIYTENYSQINWKKAASACCERDMYYPPTKLVKLLNKITYTYEKFPIKYIRKKALKFISEYIDAEDRDTNYINIGPVNKVINSIAVWHSHGKNSTQFKNHVDRWKDYMWLAEDGMKVNGYNGSQLWDTTFALQALLESDVAKDYSETIKKGYNYLDYSQIKEEVKEMKKFPRNKSVGGWPFSTIEHGWPITDCSSEGMKTVIRINELEIIPKEKQLDENRLQSTVDVIIDFQNPDGGWASYENTRAPKWIELLNPSEIFGNIMIDYSYVECSSASIQGLIKFNQKYPYYRSFEIKKAIHRGLEFIKNVQNEDGSWYGSWAICFTYAAWFGIEALVDGKGDQKTIEKAITFLMQHQNEDGGWGESYESCVQKKYIPHQKSQIINTSWALLALMKANYHDKEKIKKGIDFIISRQEINGDWPQEGISGLFNHNCMITYTAYRNVFPLWALARWEKYNSNN